MCIECIRVFLVQVIFSADYIWLFAVVLLESCDKLLSVCGKQLTTGRLWGSLPRPWNHRTWTLSTDCWRRPRLCRHLPVYRSCLQQAAHRLTSSSPFLYLQHYWRDGMVYWLTCCVDQYSCRMSGSIRTWAGHCWQTSKSFWYVTSHRHNSA